jgi:GWxTD domain-containing protein
MKSFLLLLLLAPAVFADSLVKYKDWDASPQGYLMTKAERARWAEIKTDADAEQFVNQFVAARPAGFVADVAKRAEMADKYLTAGKLPGSKTLRGKVVIVLGPPASLNVSQHRSSAVDRSMSASGQASAGAGDRGPSMADMASAAVRAQGMSGGMVTDYSFAYAGDKLPAAFSKGFTVNVEVDPGSGKDRITDRKQAAQLDELFELVAVSRLKQ